jgi:hypothetical protein
MAQLNPLKRGSSVVLELPLFLGEIGRGRICTVQGENKTNWIQEDQQPPQSPQREKEPPGNGPSARSFSVTRRRRAAHPRFGADHGDIVAGVN